MKTCSKCKLSLNLDKFTSSPKNKDGLHGWCKECVNQIRKEKLHLYRDTYRNYAKKNSDKLKEYDAKRRLTPEYKIKKKEWEKKYRTKHSDVIKAKKKAVPIENKRKWKKAEYEKNKHKYIERAYARHYNIKNFRPDDADLKLIKAFYDEAKLLTKTTGIKHEVDHIIPVSKGGLHHQNNLRVVTMMENRVKGDKIIVDLIEKYQTIRKK